MLIKVQKQDWSAPSTYAPPLVEAVVNTEEIIEAERTDSRGSGPWTKVRFRDGSAITIHGLPGQLVK